MKMKLSVAVLVFFALLLLFFAGAAVYEIIQRNLNRKRVYSVYNARHVFQYYLDYENGLSNLNQTDNPTNYLLQIAKHFGSENGYLFQFGHCNGEECVMDLWGNPFVVIWARNLEELSTSGIFISDAIIRNWRIGNCYMWSAGRNGRNDWGHGDDVP